ncbi:MAG: epimerase [Pseudomonadota bacterium]
MQKTVLILGGSGRVGRATARLFGEAGWKVRLYDRHNQSMVEAAQGCQVIVNGMNPQNYHDWANQVPGITAQVIEAAQSAGATVIIPGNVYHFGSAGGVWSERTASNPVSRKGQIRLDMERAYRKSGVQTIVLRAGNFIDPIELQCVMGLIYLRAIKKGQITLPGPALVRQAMCLVEDWARAALALAEKRSELAQFEDVPLPGQTMTGQDLRQTLEGITGRSYRFVSFPWWLFRLTGPFWELAREMNEMRYLFETDHALCGQRLSELLPDFRATPFRDVLEQVATNSVFQAGSRSDLGLAKA